MSVNRESGGNAEVLGSHDSQMGNDALPDNGGSTGEYYQGYNGEETTGPSNPQGDYSTQPLGIFHLEQLEDVCVEPSFVREGTGNRSKYAPDETVQGGHEVEVGEGDGELHYTDPIVRSQRLPWKNNPK